MATAIQAEIVPEPSTDPVTKTTYEIWIQRLLIPGKAIGEGMGELPIALHPRPSKETPPRQCSEEGAGIGINGLNCFAGNGGASQQAASVEDTALVGGEAAIAPLKKPSQGSLPTTLFRIVDGREFGGLPVVGEIYGIVQPLPKKTGGPGDRKRMPLQQGEHAIPECGLNLRRAKETLEECCGVLFRKFLTDLDALGGQRLIDIASQDKPAVLRGQNRQ